jgi:virulence-associated protein VagC
MKTTDIISIDGRQAVALPDEYRFAGGTVSIRKEGDALIIEPIRSAGWPTDFFASIRVDDPGFVRPCQGTLPPAPLLGSV